LITSHNLIDRIKTLAENNFCEKCYPKYLALIHNEIERVLLEPMSDWRQTETNINALMMKSMGFFSKNDTTAISLDRDAFLKKMKKERWGFNAKIKYLSEKGIIKESLSNLLLHVADIRHRIHKESTHFSKQDYSLFRQTKELTDIISTPIMFDLKDDMYERLLVKVENYAKQVLYKLPS
jgi:hypothetical protein